MFDISVIIPFENPFTIPYNSGTEIIISKQFIGLKDIKKTVTFVFVENVDIKWDMLIKRLEKKFNDEMSLKGILYLIGVQELNFGIKQFEREEKINVLHVATCKLLSNYGYYKFDGIDKDGWPHYKELKALQNLSENDQQILIKEAIINYIN